MSFTVQPAAGLKLVRPGSRPTLERSRRSALSFCTHGRVPELDKNCSHGSKTATDENSYRLRTCHVTKTIKSNTTDCSTKRERSRGCKLVQRWSAPEICLKNVERSSVGRVSETRPTLQRSTFLRQSTEASITTSVVIYNTTKYRCQCSISWVRQPAYSPPFTPPKISSDLRDL